MAQLSRLSSVTAIVLFFNATFLASIGSSKNDMPEVKTEEQKLFYYMGTLFGDNLLPMQLSDDEILLVMRGAQEAASGDAMQLDATVYGPKLSEFAQQRIQARAMEERAAADAYLAKMAKQDGAQQLESGLIFLPVEAGSGATPTAESVVRINYTGTLRDGVVFDTSVSRGQPIQVPLKMVIPCWQEAVTMMQVGGKAKITCPAELAYQDRGVGKIPPGAAITFDIELVEVVQ